tara:strand:+ start:391 stop:597 length:207 start_codon:yes stop_codon:yes gene_type:complete
MSEYAALVLKESLTVNILGLKQDLSLKWANGMVGAIPVFKDKESAEVYMSNVSAGVLELAVLNKDSAL